MIATKPAVRIPGWRTPVPYLAAFVFFAFTSLHESVEMLRQVHLELVLMVVSLGLGVVFWLPEGRNRAYANVQAWAVICLALAFAPLLSAYFTNGQMDVIDLPEYRTWVETLLLVPALIYFFSGERSERLLDLLFLSVFVFALVFLYRFFVLGEAREYDLRPLIQMKNGDPNISCVIFATPIPLVLYRLEKLVRPLRVPSLVGHGVLLVVFLGSALVSESRMGLLSLGVGLLFLFRKLPRSSRFLVGFLAIAFVAAGLWYGGIQDRFANVADESNRLRMKTMAVGLELFLRRPFLGNGWESGANYFFRLAGYPRLLSEGLPLQVHNTPLQLLAELGAFGFLAYTALVYRTFATIRRQRSRLRDYSLAAFLILCLNFLTLPLETKDFVFLLLGVLAAINTGADLSFGASPNFGGGLSAHEIQQA